MSDKPGAAEKTRVVDCTQALAQPTWQPAAAVKEAKPYSLRSVMLNTASADVLEQWQYFQEQISSSEPMQDLKWLRGYFEGQTNSLALYSLYKGDQMRGIAPFLRKEWPIEWTLGSWKIARFPLTRYRFLGDNLEFPEEEAAYDSLFRDLATSGAKFDTLYFEGIPLSSFLWNYLHQSKLVRKYFLQYEPASAEPRLLIRLDGTFSEYMNKFSSKHRKNLNREVKKVREGALGEMQFVRYESPEGGQDFLDKAFELSSKTYQWNLYQRGLSATDLVTKRTLFAAQHGWLRSYLLFCGGQACAFVLGFQYGDRFLLDEIGFDPALAKYSVGTVIQLLTIEDLFLHKCPSVLDFQSYGKYKEVLSTDSYPQGKILLFHRRPYSRFLRTGHRLCRFADDRLSSFLVRTNLKGRLKQKLRGWSKPQDG